VFLTVAPIATNVRAFKHPKLEKPNPYQAMGINSSDYAKLVFANIGEAY
jgi:hypothetical protein